MERSADDIVAMMPRDAFIVCAGLPAAPNELLRAICRRLPELGRPTLYCGDLSGEFAFLNEVPPESYGQLKLLIGGGPVPDAPQASVDLSPFSVYETEQLIATGRWRVDVCLVTARPPDERGEFVLSPQVACLKTAAGKARLVFAEVDATLPLLCGDTRLGAGAVTAFITVNKPATDAAPSKIGEIHHAIARRAAGLVPDGGCIQIGIGSLAEAVLLNLAGHRDLAVHSGFIGEGVMRLMQKGVVNNARYPLSPGKVVTGALLGGRELYEFADRNDRIEMRSFSHVNNPAVIAQIPNFFALNSATAVDLFGQVNAESIGGRVRSGGGGQMDFMPAAHASPEGTAVIALQSTTARGAVSRIVAPGALGGPATCHRNWVDFVVTEHGVADLRGVGFRQRAARIIEVADPKFRAELSASLDGVLDERRPTHEGVK